MKQSWFNRNKVLFIGLLSAVAVAMTPFVQTGDVGDTVTWAAIGYAAMLATIAFLGNAWRGQGATLFGVIGTALTTISNLLVSGSDIPPRQFIIQVVLQTFIAFALAVGPDPKSRGYEHSQPIIEAKKEGEEIRPAKLTDKSGV